MSNARNLSKLIPSSTGLVQTANIADDAITNAKVADDAIDTAQIADDAVENAQIGAGAVTNTEVNASAAIAATKLGTMATANMPVGSVIQTVSLTKSTAIEVATHNTYTSLYSDADCLKITPSATANKVFIQYLLDRGNGNVAGETYTEYRIITTIGGSQSNYHLSTGVLNLASGTSPYRYGTQGSYLGFVTSPTTTSEVTYNIQCRVQNSKKGTMNPYGLNVSIVAMEIKG